MESQSFLAGDCDLALKDDADFTNRHEQAQDQMVVVRVDMAWFREPDRSWSLTKARASVWLVNVVPKVMAAAGHQEMCAGRRGMNVVLCGKVKTVFMGAWSDQ